MKFKDKKYIEFETESASVMSVLDFYIYELGFPGQYDDIAVDLQIVDNVLEINFTKDTLEMFESPNECDDLLIEIHKALLQYPFLGDNYKLIFE